MNRDCAGRVDISAWRLGLLLALGGTILFASFSYDEWILIRGYVTSGWWTEVLQKRAVAHARDETRQRQAAEREEAQIHGSIQGIFHGFVHSLEALPDGKLLVGGAHSHHGLALARLEADGSLDRAFAERISRARVTGMVQDIDLKPDGILLWGTFWLDPESYPPLPGIRLRHDGTVDESSLDPSTKRAVGPVPERLLSYGGGLFVDDAYGLPRDARVYFVAEGALGSTVVFYTEPMTRPADPPSSAVGFRCGNDERYRLRRHQFALFDTEKRLVWQTEVPVAQVQSVSMQPAGGIVVRGRLRDYGVAGRGPNDDILLWRVDQRGIDPGFQPLRLSELGGERKPYAPEAWPAVFAMVVQPDGRIVVGGRFKAIRGRPRVNIARLRADGALEE